LFNLRGFVCISGVLWVSGLNHAVCCVAKQTNGVWLCLLTIYVQFLILLNYDNLSLVLFLTSHNKWNFVNICL